MSRRGREREQEKEQTWQPLHPGEFKEIKRILFNGEDNQKAHLAKERNLLHSSMLTLFILSPKKLVYVSERMSAAGAHSSVAQTPN